MERRTGAKENASQHNTRRAQNRENVSQGLERVWKAARQRKKERFTALFHHITVDLLRLSFLALKRDAAPGVDGVTWQDYEADLEREGNTLLPAFTTDYNARFANPPANKKDMHRPLRAGDDLEEAFAWKEERTLSRALTL